MLEVVEIGRHVLPKDMTASKCDSPSDRLGKGIKEKEEQRCFKFAPVRGKKVQIFFLLENRMSWILNFAWKS